MSWMKLANIRQGYIFPQMANVGAKPRDNWDMSDISDSHCTYQEFLGLLRTVLKSTAAEVFCTDKNLHPSGRARKKENSVLGTHVLRKTGYLFAIWGQLTQVYDRIHHSNIKTSEGALACISDSEERAVYLSARHASTQQANSYQQDAAKSER